MAWLSQPAQASDLPASSDSVPWDRLSVFAIKPEEKRAENALDSVLGHSKE